MITAEITGGPELMAFFNDLGNAVKKRIANEAIVTGLTPIVDAARSLAPADTGNLKNSIGFRVGKSKKGASVFAKIGPRTGFDFTDKNGVKHQAAKYGTFMEFGHLMQNGKKAPGKPFMRPAFASCKDVAMSEISRVIGTKVELMAKRAKKRKART